MEFSNNSDIFMIQKYQSEEKEFLEEENLNWENFGRNKWCWITDRNGHISDIMIDRYFKSVLLPYYLIRKNLSRSELKKLGFNPFLIKISHYNFNYEELKEKFKDCTKEDLVNLYGEKNALKKFKRASDKIDSLEELNYNNKIDFFSDVKDYCNNINEFDKNTLNNEQKLKYILSRMYKYDSNFYDNLEKRKFTLKEICEKFLIYFIQNRLKQKYIAEILNIDKRNLYELFKRYLNKNYNESKLEYFSKLMIIKFYKKDFLAFEMIKLLSKECNYVETENRFGFSKNTIIKHIKKIWEKEFVKFENNFSLLDLYLRYKYRDNIMKTKYELKYEILLNSITNDDYTGFNYLSFETRIIRYIQMFGFSVYDGYDLHGHLIEGGKASFHHLDFKKTNDDINNLIFMPKKYKNLTVNYIYHHHSIVKTREFYDIATFNMDLLEKISKENNICYAESLKNWSRKSIELLKNRLLNDEWFREIYMFLPKGSYPYKLKSQTLEYFFKKFIHRDFSYRLDIIKTNSDEFWKDYLNYRKQLRNKSSETEEIEDVLLLFQDDIDQYNQKRLFSCEKPKPNEKKEDEYF